MARGALCRLTGLERGTCPDWTGRLSQNWSPLGSPMRAFLLLALLLTLTCVLPRNPSASGPTPGTVPATLDRLLINPEGQTASVD